MKNTEAKLWLHKLFNSSYFDTSMVISYLYRYPQPGIHYYLCKKLSYRTDIYDVIPELVHVFFYHNNISFPLYNFLIHICKRNKKYAMAVYFQLNIYKEITIEQNKYKNEIINRIFNSNIWNRGNMKIKQKEYEYECKKDEDKIECNDFEMDQEIFDEILAVENTPKNDILEEIKADDNKNEIKMDDNKNEIKEFIKEKKESKDHYSYLNHPTSNISTDNDKIMSIESVFLYFVSSVSLVYQPLCKQLKDYEENLCRINEKNTTNKEIVFIEELVRISDRLKSLPKKMRERALDIELKILNTMLPKQISLPIAFDNNEILLSVCIEECKILDSAVNVPYILVYEVCKDIGVLEEREKEKIIKRKNIIKKSNEFKNVERNKNMILENINKEILDEVITEVDDSLGSKISLKLENTQNVNKNKITNFDKKINEIEDEILLNEMVLLNQLYILNENNKEKKYIKERIIEELMIVKEPIEEEKNESRIFSVINYFKGKKEEIIIKKINFNIDKERMESKYKNRRGWDVKSLIIKIGNDLRQELVAYHVLREMKKIWEEEERKIWVEPYEIYLLNERSALVEPVKEAQSIHFIKKYGVDNKKVLYLKSFFIHKYGDEKSPEYYESVSNFLYSLVGYSLVTYFLQLKDRHNGNILLKNTGQIVHIDFGFILGQHPGFYAVETAPFKFSNEYLDLLGDRILEFKILFYEGFISLRKYSERLCRTIEIMNTNNPFLSKNALDIFRDKFKLELSENEIEDYVDTLINWSLKSMTTGLYDSYQYFSNGYIK
ncbi:Phosphoinositide 4-kinase [Spraguea lophii 42_110]|uniref:Phosphoinositide 4-kinase n=1 Tax=Spraguea lophii (strain 42_110) TaxID=1358809 RepID=S7WB31_SPRLO|nr:Phosphoinositide 4-kinase [Spraguea lophii 42_110]